MVKKLIDTNILVDALRGYPPCETYLNGLSGQEVCCSVITTAEIWAGARADDAEELDLFLGAFRPLAVDEQVARQGGVYMQTYARSHGLTLPDALIAATARLAGAELITRNLKHFPMKDIRISSPY